MFVVLVIKIQRVPFLNLFTNQSLEGNTKGLVFSIYYQE